MGVITIPEPNDEKSLAALEYARKKGIANSFEEFARIAFTQELRKLTRCKECDVVPKIKKTKTKAVRPLGRPPVKQAGILAQPLKAVFEMLKASNPETFTEKFGKFERLLQAGEANSDLTILRWLSDTKPWLNPETTEIPVFGSLLDAQ